MEIVNFIKNDLKDGVKKMKKVNLILIVMLILMCTISAAGEEVISSVLTPDPNITLIEPTPTPVPKVVTIKSSAKSTMLVGEEVRLTSKISGFEGYEVSYQWQCDKGNGFEDIAGANQSTYSFPATVETLKWSWRLIVYYY